MRVVSFLEASQHERSGSGGGELSFPLLKGHRVHQNHILALNSVHLRHHYATLVPEPVPSILIKYSEIKTELLTPDDTKTQTAKKLSKVWHWLRSTTTEAPPGVFNVKPSRGFLVKFFLGVKSGLNSTWALHKTKRFKKLARLAFIREENKLVLFIEFNFFKSKFKTEQDIASLFKKYFSSFFRVELKKGGQPIKITPVHDTFFSLQVSQLLGCTQPLNYNILIRSPSSARSSATLVHIKNIQPTAEYISKPNLLRFYLHQVTGQNVWNQLFLNFYVPNLVLVEFPAAETIFAGGSQRPVLGVIPVKEFFLGCRNTYYFEKPRLTHIELSQSSRIKLELRNEHDQPVFFASSADSAVVEIELMNLPDMTPTHRYLEVNSDDPDSQNAHPKNESTAFTIDLHEKLTREHNEVWTVNLREITFPRLTRMKKYANEHHMIVALSAVEPSLMGGRYINILRLVPVHDGTTATPLAAAAGGLTHIAFKTDQFHVINDAALSQLKISLLYARSLEPVVFKNSELPVHLSLELATQKHS